MNVGDYVRIINTLNSYVEIIKIKELNEYDGYLLDERGYQYSTDEIVKSSPNIIDLIEENDFINGLRVEKNKYGELYTSYVYYGGDIGKQCEVYTTLLKEYKENEDYIVSILTKEQFESMEYKVKE